MTFDTETNKPVDQEDTMYLGWLSTNLALMCQKIIKGSLMINCSALCRKWDPEKVKQEYQILNVTSFFPLSKENKDKWLDLDVKEQKAREKTRLIWNANSRLEWQREVSVGHTITKHIQLCFLWTTFFNYVFISTSSSLSNETNELRQDIK